MAKLVNLTGYRPVDLSVRNATPSDAEAIAEIHVATWRFAYRDIMPAPFLASLSVARRAEEWKMRLSPTERTTFVLEAPAGVLGWASIGPNRDADLDTNFGELYGIYLAPSQIGKSYGQVLYGRCEEELAQRGYRGVSLWVLERNARARRFYEKSGFQLGGEKTIIVGDAELPELRYVKRLAREQRAEPSNAIDAIVEVPLRREGR